MISLRALVIASPLLLAACANFSGLDASSSLKCSAPVGLKCTSVSETYQVAKQGGLPSRANPPSDARGRPVSAEAPTGVEAPVYHGDRRAPSVQFTTPAPIPTAVAAAPGAIARSSPADFNAPSSGTPLRTPERVLRIWMAPFQDGEGDLHDQRYIYTTVTPGQWTLEAARASIRNQYQVVRPLQRSDAQSAPGSTPEAGAPRPLSSNSLPGFPQPAGVVPGSGRSPDDQQ